MKLSKIILASNSPRRQELLKGLDIPFEIKVLPDLDESYPDTLDVNDIPEYLARKKAEAYDSIIDEDTLVITADTLVILNGKVYGKPKDIVEAKQMLGDLSGKTHEVITGVCLYSKDKRKTFSSVSEVRFAQLDEADIDYYVNHYKPLDKAGAYGVQEWIGYVGVEYIAGSYFNIMGLPVQKLSKELKAF
ncbi:Maf-like protein [Dysgonomonas sp. 520]|uniref:Maf-like protein n=1 Tax=Dysgonomonas sp. 520 TaxID=2302931 RepID=UPI0013D0F870|nr:Maf-like protein [Dysgonomonas sp. 520]NDW08899.1 septum formation protein Maf [Dysgonomonas sp. 520]